MAMAARAMVKSVEARTNIMYRRKGLEDDILSSQMSRLLWALSCRRPSGVDSEQMR